MVSRPTLSPRRENCVAIPIDNRPAIRLLNEIALTRDIGLHELVRFSEVEKLYGVANSTAGSLPSTSPFLTISSPALLISYLVPSSALVTTIVDPESVTAILVSSIVAWSLSRRPR